MAMRAPDGWWVLTREEENREANAGKFGLEPQAALDFFEEQGFYMALYQPQTGGEMYVSVRESTMMPPGATLDTLNADQLNYIQSMLATAYEGWELQGEVERIAAGDHTYLALRLYNPAATTANRQLFAVHNGYEITIDTYLAAPAIPPEQASAQDTLAASLIPGYAQHTRQLRYNTLVALILALLLALLVQSVGLALAVFLAYREKGDGEERAFFLGERKLQRKPRMG